MTRCLVKRDASHDLLRWSAQSSVPSAPLVSLSPHAADLGPATASATAVHQVSRPVRCRYRGHPANLFGPVHRRLVPHSIRGRSSPGCSTPPHSGGRLPDCIVRHLVRVAGEHRVGISEALARSPTEVDLLGAVLTVRKTKFRKSRLVPLHSTTLTALTDYVEARR